MQDVGIVEQPKAQLTPRGVFAVWLQNFGGGLGAAVLAGVLAWQFGADGWTVARWALLAGALVFGVLMVLRSAVDEVVDALDYRAMIADMEALEAQIGEQKETHADEVDRLQTRIRVLQNDLNAERQRTWEAHRGPNSRSVVELAETPTAPDATRDDAEKMLERAYAGQPWGKDNMRLYNGMTSPQWFAARDLLLARGIAARGKNQTVLLHQNLADALSALHGVKLAEK